MKKIYVHLLFHQLIWILLALPLFSESQTLEQKIYSLQERLDSIEKNRAQFKGQIEDFKLEKIRRDLKQIGLPQVLPGDEITWHSAMALEYAEPFEQPRWVAHIITPDVLTGTVFRSNDFRPDSAVKTGSAAEADYFLKYLQPDSTLKYDGFGYDRGHMAPSADFRWSQKALSESYLYSNMSPQVAELNRESWATVEDKIRGYLYKNPGSQLYVVTGPVLRQGLPKIERGVNKVSIPEYFWKVAIDPLKRKGIGFIMPNRKITGPAESFAVTIDSVEKFTGINFFSNLGADIQQEAEKHYNPADWFPDIAKGDTEPLEVGVLGSGEINTTMAKEWIGDNRDISVCGTIAGGKLSRAGNILLNVDKQFPNQVFTIFIKKQYISNFSYDPLIFLKDKKICAKGKVTGLDGLPVMFIENEQQLGID